MALGVNIVPGPFVLDIGMCCLGMELDIDWGKRFGLAHISVLVAD